MLATVVVVWVIRPCGVACRPSAPVRPVVHHGVEARRNLQGGGQRVTLNGNVDGELVAVDATNDVPVGASGRTAYELQVLIEHLFGLFHRRRRRDTSGGNPNTCDVFCERATVMQHATRRPVGYGPVRRRHAAGVPSEIPVRAPIAIGSSVDGGGTILAVPPVPRVAAYA
jgi:hypothetical protein